MPLVRIEILKGKSHEYKQAMLQTIHEALMLSLNIEDDDRFQRLYELDEDCFERRALKTDKFALIELTLLPGRSKELKAVVIEEITRKLGEKLEIAPTDILIIINEPPLENWGCYGKQASEVGLEYKQN
jgi:4-oxalocrotonate tautomerase family enzyme